MNLWHLTYIVVLGIASIIGCYRYRISDCGTRLIILYTFISFCAEFTAMETGRHFGNNLMVYAIYSLLELPLVVLYFSIRLTSKPGTIFFALLLSVVFYALQFPSNLYQLVVRSQLLQSVLVPVLAMLYFRQELLRVEPNRISRDIHFWFCALLFFYRCCTLFYWLWSSDYSSAWALAPYVNHAMEIVHLLLTLLLCTLFFCHSRLSLRR